MCNFLRSLLEAFLPFFPTNFCFLDDFIVVFLLFVKLFLLILVLPVVIISFPSHFFVYSSSSKIVTSRLSSLLSNILHLGNILFTSLASYSHKLRLVGFHCRLSDSKSISRTTLSILADPNYVVVWVITILSRILNSACLFFKPSPTIPWRYYLYQCHLPVQRIRRI